MNASEVPVSLDAGDSTWGDLAAIDWEFWETVIRRRGVIIERPKGSAHPRYSGSRYPVDYGFIPETTGGDGEAVDVFVESTVNRELVGAIITHDGYKQDVEIKLLWNMSEDEVSAVHAFINRGQMSGRLIFRPVAPEERTLPCASP